MRVRFHKVLTLFKGVRLNISKRGASLSVGKPGATLNAAWQRFRATIGLPGTGLSASQDLTREDWSHNLQPELPQRPRGGWVKGLLVFSVMFVVGFCSAFGAPPPPPVRVIIVPRVAPPPPRVAPAPPKPAAPAPIPKAPAPTPKPAPARAPVAEQQPVTSQPWFWFWFWSRPSSPEKCVNTREQPHRCDERNLKEQHK